jgi:hypothetical protein
MAWLMASERFIFGGEAVLGKRDFASVLTALTSPPSFFLFIRDVEWKFVRGIVAILLNLFASIRAG